MLLKFGKNVHLKVFTQNFVLAISVISQLPLRRLTVSAPTINVFILSTFIFLISFVPQSFTPNCDHC